MSNQIGRPVLKIQLSGVKQFTPNKLKKRQNTWIKSIVSLISHRCHFLHTSPVQDDATYFTIEMIVEVDQ